MPALSIDAAQLRLMGPGDRDLVLHWRNQDRVRQWMYTTDVISRERHAEWFMALQENEAVDYQIFEYEGQPAGLVNFTRIDELHGSAYWGFYLGEAGMPRGIGAVMELRALDHAFDVLSLRKLSCEVIASNKRVIRLHQRFGFAQQAHYVEHIVREDGPEDVIGLYLLAQDWRAGRPDVIASLESLLRS